MLMRILQIKRQIKLVTEQHVLPDVPSEVEGFPMREWSIEIYVVGPNDEQLPATCFEKVTYRLHESFGKRANQSLKQPPFRIQEQGWGEFDMSIVLQPFSQPKGEQTVFHDLNFQQERYENLQQFTFRNPKPELIERLRESGPVGDANGAAKPEKRKKASKTQVDMEKLAEGLERLGEDDLLHVVQLVHDNKTEDTYTKNDVESEWLPIIKPYNQALTSDTDGEFHVDLYTLPDQLIKMLWDFVNQKVNISEF
ncbi:transcription factor TFIIF complex subunit [Aureobasidium subglaciale]|nr:transcription factor TFIIF complex subunit [Aureobasidium subglaciale]